MLREYVSNVSDVLEVCFICIFRTRVVSVFIWMLHMFHTYVASALSGCLQWFSIIFASVSDACSKCFICLFCMLQVLHLNVSKGDRVLHKRYVWEARGGASSPRAGDVWAAWVPRGRG